MEQSFAENNHLTNQVMQIKYIRCATKADMFWKKIYYANYFNNEKMESVDDVYDSVTDIGLNDKWMVYEKDYYEPDYISIAEQYAYLITNPPKYDYRNLIHIISNQSFTASKYEKDYRDTNYLSQSWIRNADEEFVTTAKNRLRNFFRNYAPNNNFPITKTNMLWTTFPKYKHSFQSKGFVKSYVNFGEVVQADEEKRILAYMCNNYYPKRRGTNVDESNRFALALLLSFIFQSAIRDGKEIWIYIPSIRMRNLLVRWIDENSAEN